MGTNKSLMSAKPPYQHYDKYARDFRDSTVVRLQRVVGNHAMQNIMDPSSISEGGLDFSNHSAIQPKLRISQPGDSYEQEADRIAEQVMRTSDSSHPIGTLLATEGEGIDRKCAACEMEGEDEEQKKKREGEDWKISRKASTESNLETTNEFTNEVDNIHNSAGSPIDIYDREFMESRFGHDFGNVKIHTGEMAARSANSVNALAYTIGNDIVFGEGQYKPTTFEGRRLLAHELAHTIQQGQSNKATRLLTTNRSSIAKQNGANIYEDGIVEESAFWPQKQHQSSAGKTSEIIQLTPAPPTYGGVTGSRDLSKIHIDAVPDIRSVSLPAVNVFFPPRVINVHISDPSVVHLSWLLYDPTDSMMQGSFSTIPGNPNSTKAPFLLTPTNFPKSGLIEGQYLLRCVGLDAQH